MTTGLRARAVNYSMRFWQLSFFTHTINSRTHYLPT